MGVKLGNGKWAIKEDKLLAYNDNSGRFFNKEFDFSRGSSATYVAKDGLIKTAGLQETNLVNNGDFSELGSELININNWILGNYWSNYEGILSLNGENNDVAYQENIFTVGKIYKATFNINVSSGNLNLRFRLRNTSAGGSQQVLEEVSQGGTYTYFFEAEFPDINLVALSNNTAVFSIDNISVKQVDPNDYWTLGTGWSIGDGVASCDGSQTGFVTINQSNVVASGKLYKIKFTLTRSAGSIRPEVGSSGLGTFVSQSGTFTQYITQAGNNTLYFKSDSNFVGSITNISVQEVQTDTPRIDFSDSVKGALLLEPQSTNLITYSEDFNVWQNGGGTQTIVANATTSPEGLQNASSIQIDSGYVYKQVSGLSISSGDQYTWSCYVNSSSQKIRFGGGTVGGTDVYSSEDVGNGWYRQKFTRTFTTSGSIIQPMFSDSISGTDLFYIWGAQLEAKSFSTSYIPTFGSTATRLADVCINSGSAQDFNSEEGVLYAEIAALANENSTTAISINDGTTSNAVQLFITNTINQIRARVSNSTAQFFEEITLSDITNFNKIAIKYKQNDFALWVNGNEVATDTSGNTPLGLNNLSFDRGDGANDFNAKIREVQVFTEALTDEQLQKLTTI